MSIMGDNAVQDDVIDLRNCENNICRICLSFTDLLLPIFNGEGAEQNLELKIQKYLPVKIAVTDPLPQQLCFHCADALISWDSLVTICLESDRKLKCLIGLSSPGKEKKDGRECDSKSDIKKESFGDTADGSESNDVSSGDVKQRKGMFKRMKRKLQFDEDTPKIESGSVLMEIKTEDSECGDGRGMNEETDGDKETLTCEFCGKSYKDKRYLARHIKLSHKETKITEMQKCDLCANEYKTRANLERHYKKEHLSNQVSCPVCHASLHSRKLDSHLRSVHGVKAQSENDEKFKCKFCDKWFKNKYIRNSHVKEIHLTEQIKCKLCDFQGVRAALRRHRTEVHAEKRFPCSLCSSAFKTLHTLKMHMTSHSDLRSFTCDVCGMGFKRLNNVRDHMKCHEQKSNQCQICGNFFARKRYLAIHEKTIHNFYADGVIPEEKGFECEICGAKLKWKKNLLAHMRIHTGEKPYVCKICKKDFVCHGSLRTHMGKHAVCAITENAIMSSAGEGMQDSEPSPAIGLGLFGHFSI